MALGLLDGTDATVDCGFVFSGTVSSSVRCIANSMAFRTTRSYQSAETLCSGQDVSELPGKRQSFINIGKFASKGATISDFSPFFALTAAATVNWTSFTGCTHTGAFWIDENAESVAAGQVAMPGSMSFRSSGGIATSWVIS